MTYLTYTLATGDIWWHDPTTGVVRWCGRCPGLVIIHDRWR